MRRHTRRRSKARVPSFRLALITGIFDRLLSQQCTPFRVRGHSISRTTSYSNELALWPESFALTTIRFQREERGEASLVLSCSRPLLESEVGSRRRE